MTGLVLIGVVIVALVLTARLFTPRPPVKEFEDPTLGLFTYDPETEGWRCGWTAPGRTPMSIVVDGDPVPIPALLERAAAIVASGPAFFERLSVFLLEQARVRPEHAEEIRHLEPYELGVGAAGAEMVFFNGPQGESRAWRCDIKDDGFASLGFDS